MRVIVDAEGALSASQRNTLQAETSASLNDATKGSSMAGRVDVELQVGLTGVKDAMAAGAVMVFVIPGGDIAAVTSSIESIMDVTDNADNKGDAKFLAEQFKDVSALHDSPSDLAIANVAGRPNSESKAATVALAGDLVHEGVGHRAMPKRPPYHSERSRTGFVTRAPGAWRCAAGRNSRCSRIWQRNAVKTERIAAPIPRKIGRKCRAENASADEAGSDRRGEGGRFFRTATTGRGRRTGWHGRRGRRERQA